MKASAIQHVGPERVAWREVEVHPPAAGEVLIDAECSAISAGSECLIFRGQMPSELELDASIPALRRPFTYPVAYGYGLVGRVAEVGCKADEPWLGKRVFLFHPHQDRICATADECIPVPADISDLDALFLPNTESAVNFVMDARPVVGERFLVLGQGVVGLLTSAILASFPLTELMAVDPIPARREWAERLGAVARETLCGRIADGSPAGAGFDGTIELSGNMDALNAAIENTGFGGRIIVGSWYGSKTTMLHLGGVFHRRRLQLISSQVSTLAPNLGGRWNKLRRLELAWDWVRKIGPQRLITDVFSPDDCQQAFERAAHSTAGALQIIFRY